MKRTLIKYNLIGLFFVLLLVLIFFLVSSHDAGNRVVLLSFDVEPVDGESVLELIQVLDSAGVNATFFVTGDYAEQYPEVMMELGRFEVGCHSVMHKKLTKLNDSLKRFEIAECQEIVGAFAAQDVVGFRAPWHAIDLKSMMILEEENYLYDASVISGLGVFFPSPDAFDIVEILVSSVMGIPVEDVIWMHYFKMPGVFFNIMESKDGALESYVFHPHHIVKEKERFKETIKTLKGRNVSFISHTQLIKQHEGV